MIGAVVLMTAASTAEQTVNRLPVWGTMEEQVKETPGALGVPVTGTRDWKGFVNEGDRIRGEKPGDSFAYTVERSGTFFFGVVLVDDPDGTERLEVSLNGALVGTIVADESGGKALFSFSEPLVLAAGDRLVFTCKVPVGYYRIYQLLFSPTPLQPPTPAFEFIEPWVREPGTVELCWTTTTVAPTGYVELSAEGEAPQKIDKDYEGRNHRVLLTGLDAAKEYEARIVTQYRGEEVVSAPFRFRASLPVPPPTQSARIALSVPEPTDTPRREWPATVGMPFAKGALAGPEDLRLFQTAGDPVPLQRECLCRWPDGSVKWATLSFPADSSSAGTDYWLEARPDWSDPPPAVQALASVQRVGDGWYVKTDTLAFEVKEDLATLFSNLTVAGKTAMLGGAAALAAVLPDGTDLVGGGPIPGTFVVEENGPCRTILRWRGILRKESQDAGWTCRVRLMLTRGQPMVGIDVALCNEQAEPAFSALKSLAVCFPNAGQSELNASLNGAEAFPLDGGNSLTLLQDKDNHFSCYHGTSVEEGIRAEGMLSVWNDGEEMNVFLRDFWQSYPSGLHASQASLEVQLLPPLPSDLYSDGESLDLFPFLYAWFDEGNYLFRAGQTTRHNIQVAYGMAATGTNVETRRAWLASPLLPQATPAYLCGTGVLSRTLYAETAGLWDAYETLYEESFDRMTACTDKSRTYGWMHYGDWRFGDTIYGNNEYDLAWSAGLQWMRTGKRRYFDRGLQMARHYSTVDTVHGSFVGDLPCVVWKHCFNHVGAERLLDEIYRTDEAEAAARENGVTLYGGTDPQGHIFEEGLWLYGALTGERWFTDTAAHVCEWQAEKLTPSFDFEIERGGGWPLICAVRAYEFSGNPFYLNAARIMVERCCQRHDPEHGGWPHTPPLGETGGIPVVGGKAFATGILGFGLLRYLDAEPLARPDVRRMLVNTAHWLRTESWAPKGGFVYITNSPENGDTGSRGCTCLLVAEIIAFAYEETRDEAYLNFLKDIFTGTLDGTGSESGKQFTQQTRQTVYALDRARHFGLTQAQ